MSTTKIYMDLSLASTWIAADAQDSTIPSSSSYDQKEANTPKVIWALNTVPFSGGAKSLSPVTEPFLPALPLLNDSTPNDIKMEILISSEGNVTYLYSEGKNILLQWVFRLGLWKKLYQFNTTTNWHSSHTVFQNQTLIALPNSGGAQVVFDVGLGLSGDAKSGSDVALYNQSTHVLDVFNLTGIDLNVQAGISGVTSFQNYLLFWDKSRVYWSSPTDFQDFTPAIGGGGSEKISEAKGNILTIVPNPQGLVIYCKKNIVHASFSGDAANPWIFNEIANSSGVLINFDHNTPLVTLDESSQIQVAATVGGLVAVTTNDVAPLTLPMREFSENLEVENKAVGSCDFTRRKQTYFTDLIDTTKLYKLTLIKDMLFISTGAPIFLGVGETDYNTQARTYAYNLRNGRLAALEGSYMAVGARANVSKYTAIPLSESFSTDLIPNQYVGVTRTLENARNLELLLLDFAGGTERGDSPIPAILDLRDAELLVGVVSISRNVTTIIHRVQLDGRLHADTDTEGVDRCRVFVYSKEILGATAPVEFTFNPADGNYYGYIEGKDLQVEVRGKNFYITGMEIELERGGLF